MKWEYVDAAGMCRNLYYFDVWENIKNRNDVHHKKIVNDFYKSSTRKHPRRVLNFYIISSLIAVILFLVYPSQLNAVSVIMMIILWVQYFIECHRMPRVSPSEFVLIMVKNKLCPFCGYRFFSQLDCFDVKQCSECGAIIKLARESQV